MYRIIVLLLIPILFLSITSLRPLRLKIGDYYFKHGTFDQAVGWYEKVARKGKLKVGHDESARLKYEEDLTKLNSVLLPFLEKKLFNISKLLGFSEGKDLKTLLIDPKFFLKDVNELVGNGSKERLQKAKEDLVNFINISSYYKSLFGKGPNSENLNYLISMGYFLTGIIDEAENNLISADLMYENIIKFYPESASYLNEKRNRILSKMADEYFSLHPSFKKVGNAYVLLESESPLIITGFSPGPGHYLEYEACPIRIVMQKYPTPQFKIQGEVFGKITTSCIIPNVVFWGTKGYLGETDYSKRPVNGKFDIYFSFAVPEGTVNVTPRIRFDPSCLSEGQKILIRDFKWG